MNKSFLALKGAFLSQSSGRRLRTGFLAQGYAQLATIVLQLATVPVLLSAWGPERYGVWLLLTAIPAYLSLADLGFAQVAATQMSLKVSNEDYQGAARVLQSGVALFAFLCTGLIPIVSTAILFSPVLNVLQTNSIERWELMISAGALTGQVLLGILFGLVAGALRSVGQQSWAVFASTNARVLEAVCVMIIASVAEGFTAAGVTLLGVRIVVTALAIARLRVAAPWYSLTEWRLHYSDIRGLISPSLTFVAFTLGALVNIQGATIVLGMVLGPTAVATFATFRTFTRLGVQTANLFNYTWQPEYSLAFGKHTEGLPRFTQLLKVHYGFILLFTSLFGASAFWAGHFVIEFWTHGTIVPEEPILTLLIIGVLVEMLWTANQTPLLATNKHSTSSLAYLAFSVLGLCYVWIVGHRTGLIAIASANIAVGCMMLIVTSIGVRRLIHGGANVS